MPSKLRNSLKVIVLNIFSLFSRKKRVEAVLAETQVTTPITPKIEVQRTSHVPAAGRLRDITMMLDQESAELYSRTRYIRD